MDWDLTGVFGQYLPRHEARLVSCGGKTRVTEFEGAQMGG